MHNSNLSVIVTQIFLSVILFFFSKNVAVQDGSRYEKQSFAAYSDFVSKAFNISCKMPENFTDLKYMEPWKIREKGSAGMFYCPVLQSDNKEYILMYCFTPFYYEFGMALPKEKRTKNDSINSRMNDIARGQIKVELLTALGNELNENGWPKGIIDFDDYVTVLSGKEARKRFNADSIFLYNIPLEQPFKEEYVYCTGMAIARKGRPTMYFKWFFTEGGKRKEEKYIKKLNKKVWYNNGEWTYDDETYKEELANFWIP